MKPINKIGMVFEEIMFKEHVQYVYKNQLQSYAQKRHLSLPTYSCMREGPPHANRFKCKVTFYGRTYETQEFFSTLKEAEQEAAKVALMSLSIDGIQEDDDYGLYKNLLQELAHKEGYALPIYKTTRCGVPHTPTFVSTVKVEHETFLGQEVRKKKLATMSAAKVAYMTLKERKPNKEQLCPSLAHKEQANDSFSNLQANVITDPHENVRPSGGMVSNPSEIPSEQADDDRVDVEICCLYPPYPFQQTHMIKTSKRDSSSSDLSASRKRIRVCPVVPNMTVPEGSEVVHNDDNWVSLKLTS